MTRKFHTMIVSAVLALSLSLLESVPAQAAKAAYKEKNLYDFCQLSQCLDGSTPYGDLLIDAAGNIYGTTSGGGAGDGLAFEFMAFKKKYRYVPIHAFGLGDSLYGPVGDFIQDTDGNLYGTTDGGGGSSGSGGVFELKPSGTKWTFAPIYYFAGGSGDGAIPRVGLTYAGKASGQPWDGSSPLYGTTAAGGKYGNGVVYELVFNGSSWTETILHNFQTSAGPTGLIEDSGGNLWGTTESGGANGGGLLYRLAGGTWKETVLYQFCASQNCTDGSMPIGRLFMDSSGDIFGTTYQGGANCSATGGCGAVFELTSGGTYQVIYNFCSAANCIDGAYPKSGVIINQSGALVGSTFYGGNGAHARAGGSGVAFELINSGGSWSETVIHAFCSANGCTDGEFPASDPVADGSGRIFGVTEGGTTSIGNAYELTPR